MTIKKTLQVLIKSFIFIIILSACIFAVMIVLQRKDSRIKYADFFDEAKKDHIDVLFMGSSHVINGINPMELFEQYGFTSYNMGGHGSVMQATYWELIEALDYCTPKWVVVDAYMLEKNYQYLDEMDGSASESEIKTSVEQLHLNMDVWPLNKLKIAAISDLIKEQSVRNEFLFDFLIYHSRWNDLDSEDYKALFGKEERNSLMGAEMRYDVEISPVSYPYPSENETLGEHTVGQEYLMKIIDECQRRGIGVLVTYFPFCATTQDRIAANSAGVIANMYDVPYINMLDAGIIDLNTDLNDIGHLNAAGAHKVTDYVGKWLYDNANLKDHRNDEDYADWMQRVLDYDDECIALACDNSNLYTQLEMLSLSNVSSIIYFNHNSMVFSDDSIKSLIINISGTDIISTSVGPYILINDVSCDKVFEAQGDDTIDGADTMLGTMVYQPVEDRFRLLYAKENEEYNYLYDDEHLLYDIQIITYSNDTGEVLTHNYYRSYGGQYRTD